MPLRLFSRTITLPVIVNPARAIKISPATWFSPAARCRLKFSTISLSAIIATTVLPGKELISQYEMDFLGLKMKGGA